MDTGSQKTTSKKNLKDHILKIIEILFTLYIFFSLSFAAPYYNWQYAKEHGFLQWVLGGEIVSTSKAFFWPYFAFANSFKNAHIPSADHLDETQKNINSFFEAYFSLHDAFELLENIERVNFIDFIDNLDSFRDDWEDGVFLLKEANKELEKIDYSLLNDVYEGWGDIVRDALSPAISYRIDSIENSNDSLLGAKFNASMRRYNNWMEKNWHLLIQELDDNFYLEIK